MIGGDSVFSGAGNNDRAHVVVQGRGRRLQPRQHLQPGLRLPRLGGLGAETIDESLQVLALRLLLLGEFRIQHLALAALPLERRIAAAIEGELAVFQMQDRIHRIVEQSRDHG